MLWQQCTSTSSSRTLPVTSSSNLTANTPAVAKPQRVSTTAYVERNLQVRALSNMRSRPSAGALLTYLPGPAAALSHETRSYIHLQIDTMHIILFKSKVSFPWVSQSKHLLLFAVATNALPCCRTTRSLLLRHNSWQHVQPAAFLMQLVGCKTCRAGYPGDHSFDISSMSS